MNWMEIMKQRHSVRQYTDQQIPADIRKKLEDEVSQLNSESGMHMQLFFDEPECFDSLLAHYGKFTNVMNYLAVVGRKSESLEEKAGYYGEMVVLTAQSLGLNSCWVGMTHGKSHAVTGKEEKQVLVIALGYGANQGVPHQSKPMNELCRCSEPMPAWFTAGMEAAMLSSTAVNQQKFLITWDGSHLKAQLKGRGFFAKTDLGIVKRDFELASGHTFD